MQEDEGCILCWVLWALVAVIGSVLDLELEVAVWSIGVWNCCKLLGAFVPLGGIVADLHWERLGKSVRYLSDTLLARRTQNLVLKSEI